MVSSTSTLMTYMFIALAHCIHTWACMYAHWVCIYTGLYACMHSWEFIRVCSLQWLVGSTSRWTTRWWAVGVVFPAHLSPHSPQSAPPHPHNLTPWADSSATSVPSTLTRCNREWVLYLSSVALILTPKSKPAFVYPPLSPFLRPLSPFISLYPPTLPFLSLYPRYPLQLSSVVRCCS